MAAAPRMATKDASRDEPRDIHDRCVEWASWARCPAPGGGSEASGYLRERTESEHAGEPTAEIALTDRAVARMKVQRKDYWRAFSRYYLNPTSLTEEEIADDIHLPAERVNAMLRQARILVGFHLHQLRSAK